MWVAIGGSEDPTTPETTNAGSNLENISMQLLPIQIRKRIKETTETEKKEGEGTLIGVFFFNHVLIAFK